MGIINIGDNITGLHNQSDSIQAVYHLGVKVWPDSNNAFIIEFSVEAQTLTIPLYNTTGYNCSFNWGDGSAPTSVTAYDGTGRTHVYATPGIYQVLITGTCKGIFFNNTGDKNNLIKIIQWGSVGMCYMDCAFYFCSNLVSIPNVCAPPDVNTIDTNAYRYTSITAVNIPTTVTTIGNFAFANITTLSAIAFPSSVTSLGTGVCFYNSALTSVSIPTSITTIPIQAFEYCTALQTITFPSSLKSIGDSALRYCTSCVDVIVNAVVPPTFGGLAFENMHANRVFHVPAGSLAAYKAAAGWSVYADVIFAM